MDLGLEINNLTKKLSKNKIISVANLSISKGKKVALLGLNGAGKSSFIRLLVGESKLDSGEINYRAIGFDHSQTLHPQVLSFKKRLGYQADTMLAITGMTGGEYLNLCGRFKQLSSKQIEGKLKWLCQLWQIDELLNQKMSELSKGNLQKLAIAQAFIVEAKWLFFDEPCQSLDPLEQDRFNQNIKNLVNIELCIFSTHNVEHALEVADDIVVFHQCKIAYHFKSENQQDYLLVCKKNKLKMQELANELNLTIVKIAENLYQLPSINTDQAEKFTTSIGQDKIEFCLPESQAVMPLFRLLASGELDANLNGFQ